MKRILTSPIAAWVYLLFAFTIGAIVGAVIANKEFMSWNIKPDREYIAFEVRKLPAKERYILGLEIRMEQVIKAFEAYQYQVDRITILRKGQKVNITLEED